MATHCDACLNALEQTKKINETLTKAATEHSRPPFSEYLDLVSFVAVITISFSLSASQGFATSQSLFGVTLDANGTDPVTQLALQEVSYTATLLSWSAATSAFSLMIALALRILQTYDLFVELSQEKEGPWALLVGIGSWTALASQAVAMILIGQSLKTINLGSGWMIEVGSLS